VDTTTKAWGSQVKREKTIGYINLMAGKIWILGYEEKIPTRNLASLPFYAIDSVIIGVGSNK